MERSITRWERSNGEADQVKVSKKIHLDETDTDTRRELQQ